MGGLLKFVKLFGFKVSCKRVAAIDNNNNNDRCGDGGGGGEEKSGVMRFSWDQVEKFSKNFGTVVGNGSSSIVYLADKVLCGSNVAAAAVKVQFCSSERLNRAYKQELEILLHIRHPNIVKLLGYCDDHDEGVLVLEYVRNGSLEEKLHGSKKLVLSWRRRMTIAFQLAQALEYLHHKQIVHGDIKASNVLLDDNLDCKLCDFGSAKMGFSSTILPPFSDSPFAKRNNRIMIMGSPGYTDPHYLRTGLATKNNDVYSFGIILLELITGNEACSPSSGERLVTKAEPMLRNADTVINMVDQRLIGRDLRVEEAKAMAALSAMCLCDSPSLRPSASDILTAMRNKIQSISFV